MAKHPNLVFVFPDELRSQAVGPCKEDPVISPVLDAFCRESLAFTNAVSPNPVCSPFRGMLFTGNYPHLNHVTQNCNTRTAPMGVYLREDETTLSDVLKSEGYFCGYIGKWHLDAPKEEDAPYTEGRRPDGLIWDSYTPPEARHGFDFWHVYGCCDNHNHPHYWEGGDIRDRIDVDEWSPIHETDVAVDFIKNQPKDRPFALFLAHNPPHMPFAAVPERYLRLYDGISDDEILYRPNIKGATPELARDARQYFAAITGIDEQFGRVLAAIDEAGIKDDTIVIFTSDHGDMMGSQGLIRKSYIQNESYKIPFMIRWPGVLQPRVTDMLISAVDMMPTLLTMLGIDARPAMQGQDIGRAILENRDGSIGQTAFLVDNMKRRGLMDRRYTFAMEVDADAASFLLYDNIHDPYQLHNLALTDEALKKTYMRRLSALLDEIGDPDAPSYQAFLKV